MLDTWIKQFYSWPTIGISGAFSSCLLINLFCTNQTYRMYITYSNICVFILKMNRLHLYKYKSYQEIFFFFLLFQILVPRFSKVPLQSSTCHLPYGTICFPKTQNKSQFLKSGIQYEANHVPSTIFIQHKPKLNDIIKQCK